MSGMHGKNRGGNQTAYYDGADHWLSRKDCLALGIVNEEADDYDAAAPPKDIEKMAYPELLAAFQEKRAATPAKLAVENHSLILGTHEADGMDTPTIVHNPTQEDMVSIEAIQAALADGSLKADDLQASCPRRPQRRPAREGLLPRLSPTR